jgi:acyl carrier protein
LEKQELQNFLREEIMNLAFKQVSTDESLIKSKLLDSISVVDLLVVVEEKIGKTIPQHLVKEENFDSIDKIMATLDLL